MVRRADTDLLCDGYTRQISWPLHGLPWDVKPDLAGYEPPDRSKPAIQAQRTRVPTVTVIGTVRDEREAFLRSWTIWACQKIPVWMSVEFIVLDEGSSAEDEAGYRAQRALGFMEEPPGKLNLRYIRTRPPGDPAERSCTLAFNFALRHLVRSPLVMFQWWDRIPGGFDHLWKLVRPHMLTGGIVTTAVARHIGGSSSVADMTPEALRARLAMVAWEQHPETLDQIAGYTGNHVLPGAMTESAGLCIPTTELIALGGWDERYTTRASYVNVELWRRILHAGLVAWSPPGPSGSCYHQSHPCPGGRQKDFGWLADPRIRRNQNIEWGAVPPGVTP